MKIGLERAGFQTVVSSAPLQLSGADAIVLPGVGSFSAASRKLGSFRAEILGLVEKGTPLLGICLGMQLLFSESDEGGGRGLEVFEGKNVRLPRSVKTPHIGWNTLHIVKPTELLEGVDDECFLYFVHSLHPVPNDRTIVHGETDYGCVFPSVIAERNIYGTQFHPEKSGQIGSRILENFFNIAKR